jgi:hypothetical protein
MILIVFSALLGAFLGLTRESKVSAMLVSGVLAAALHTVLTATSGWMLMEAENHALALGVIRLVGGGEPLWTPVAAAFGSAALAALMTGGADRTRGGLYLADDGEWKPDRRKKKRPTRREPIGAGKTFGEMMRR